MYKLKTIINFIFFIVVLIHPVISTTVVIVDIPNCQTTTKYQVNGSTYVACTQCQSPSLNGVDKIPLILYSSDGLSTDHSQGIAC